MSSTIYFPIINYKYVRKANIAELTGNLFSQEDVDKVLDEVEQKLSSFQKRKWIDQNITRLSNFFPVCFIIGILVALFSMLATIRLGTFIGLCLITLSVLLLLILIVSTLKTGTIDQAYKIEIEEILNKKNEAIESTDALWKVGNNNMLEIHFKEAWEFDEYYDNDDEDD